jgi:uncharacterized protein (TIGR03086 family)
VSEIADRYRKLAASFTARVDAVRDDRWSNPSPCEGWTAVDIVRHMTETAGIFYSLVGRELPPIPSVDDDPKGAWAATRNAIQRALDDPAFAGLPYEGQLGHSTFEVGVDKFLSGDLLLHTWDLARATGLDERLDPDEVSNVLSTLTPMDEVMRAPGAFGPKVEAPDGADEQTQLLAFAGRRV